MIYDKLNNIGCYKGLNKNLDTAIDFILSNDLTTLPLGQTTVDGRNVYINCMETKTGLINDKQYEVHQEYMDIQITLLGAERIIIGDKENMEMNVCNSEEDCSLGQCSPLADCMISPGSFIICMIGEPHMPGVALQQPIPIKKCVFKVHK